MSPDRARTGPSRATTNSAGAVRSPRGGAGVGLDRRASAPTYRARRRGRRPPPDVAARPRQRRSPHPSTRRRARRSRAPSSPQRLRSRPRHRSSRDRDRSCHLGVAEATQIEEQRPHAVPGEVPRRTATTRTNRPRNSWISTAPTGPEPTIAPVEHHAVARAEPDRLRAAVGLAAAAARGARRRGGAAWRRFGPAAGWDAPPHPATTSAAASRPTRRLMLHRRLLCIPRRLLAPPPR